MVVIGIIIVGPEKLPRVIEDVRAAIYAARKAINNAKAELNGEFGEDLEEFQKPLSQIASIQRMGPRGVITKALFDDDEEFMESFNPKKLIEEDPRPSTRPSPRKQRRQAKQEAARSDSHAAPSAQPTQPARPTFNYAEIYARKNQQQATPTPQNPQSKPQQGTEGPSSVYGDVI